MNNPSTQHPAAGDPLVSRRRGRISLVWLVPGVAALIGMAMLVHTWMSAGPEIDIAFRTAAGMEAGKTVVKYKDVTVGAVSAITLSDDGSHVVARVALAKSASRLTRKDTRFWVVRPRVGVGGVSGIDTLLSGAYIAVDAGTAAESSKSFTGLETPPTVIGGTRGRSFVLHTADMGSLDIGSPIYYRRVQVGRVASYRLDDDGQGVSVQIFINAPYDRFVTTDARFWNASGVDVSLGADGLKLKTQSVTTIVAGGIAFAVPEGAGKAAPEDTHYALAKDQATAMAPPDGPSQSLQLRFSQSLRGLSVGAPVQFYGLEIGRVVSMELDYAPAARTFTTVVNLVIHPQRLGRALDKLPKAEMKADADSERQRARFLLEMVAQGLRAQARPGNLLTGQLYISLDFMPNAPRVVFDELARPLVLPTVNSSLDQLQDQVGRILGKIEKIPFDSIGRNLDRSLTNLDKTLEQVNGQVLPQTMQTFKRAEQTFDAAQGLLAEDAPLQQHLGQTLQEVQQTARSVRVLTDLLGRHPQALLRGLPEDPSAAALQFRNPNATVTQESQQ